MTREAIYREIDGNLEADIAAIQALVRCPSVSLEGSGLSACAEQLKNRLTEIGCQEAAVVDLGDAYPGVWGRLDCGADKTILYYSHYDVRPVGQAPWDRPPFAADIVESPPYRRVIVGRGARGSKGPLGSWLNALRAIMAAQGRLPVNVIFLIEGAEILGSCNFLRFAERYREAIRDADALLSPGASQNARGEVSVVLGYKGLLYLELEATGEAWGRGPGKASVHSATSAVVDSPAWRLIHALASLTDAEGTRLTVEGLDKAFVERRTLAPWEQECLTTLQARFAGRDPHTVIPGLSPNTPVMAFKRNLAGPDLLKEYLYASSVNVSGLRSGYVGPGSASFLLPHIATATLDIRLVSDLTAEEVLGRLRAHLDRAGYPEMQLRVFGAFDGGQTAPDADIVEATLATLRAHGYPAVVWPMVAFGGPWAHLPKALGIPALRGAAPGYGDRMAGANEFFVVEGDGTVPGLAGIERYYVDLLYAYAAQ